MPNVQRLWAYVGSAQLPITCYSLFDVHAGAPVPPAHLHRSPTSSCESVACPTCIRSALVRAVA